MRTKQAEFTTHCEFVKEGRHFSCFFPALHNSRLWCQWHWSFAVPVVGRHGWSFGLVYELNVVEPPSFKYVVFPMFC
jgi:hypothetical protein